MPRYSTRTQQQGESNYDPPIPISDVDGLQTALNGKAEKRLSIKAGENLSAGNLVKIVRVSGETVAKKIRNNNPDFFTQFIVGGTGTSWTSYKVYNIDTDRVLIAGISGSALHCAIYNHTTNTLGTSVQVDTSTVTGVHACIDTTNNIIVVGWTKSSVGYTRLLTWSGETLTAQGSNQRVNGTATGLGGGQGGLFYHPVADRVACNFTDGTWYTIGGQIVGSPTWAITWDDANKINSTSTYTESGMAYDPITENFMSLGAWSPATRNRLFKFVSGVLTSASSTFEPGPGSTTLTYKEVTYIGNGRILFSALHREGHYLRIYQVNSGSVTSLFVQNNQIDFPVTTFITSVYDATEDIIYLIYYDIGLCHYIVLPCQFDGSTLHYGLPTVYSYAGSNTGVAYAISGIAKNGNIIGIYRTRHDSNYNHVITTSLYDDRMNLFGFVKEGATSGNNAVITPIGFLDDTRGGLQVGRHYFISSEGNLQTKRTPFYYGVAISGTEIQTCDLTIGRQVL